MNTNMNTSQVLYSFAKQRFGDNPIINNALNMMQHGDEKGLEQLARNLCLSKGINVDMAIQQIRNQYRI